MVEDRKLYKVLVGKNERKRQLGRLRRRWEYGIKRDLRERSLEVWNGLNWLRVGTMGAAVNAVMNLRCLAPHT
jgi:hypothetical protein